jgi:hypothetical protein
MMTDTPQDNSFTPAIHLLFSSPSPPNPNESTLTKRIAALEKSRNPPDIQAAWRLQDPAQSLGDLHFGQHTIQITGLAAPLPNTVINRTVHVSHWQPQVKAAMRQHRSHLNLIYQGHHPDPVEKMIALYQTAHAFEDENLLGIVNRQAWTAHPPADYLSTEKISAYRENFPFLLWVGYVKFYTDKDHYWLATKGHHIFDVPDLAYFVKSQEDTSGITDHFTNIFYYLYNKDVFVTAGDTLEIGKDGAFFRFTEIPEDTEFLMGPSGTLVLEKINPEDKATDA